MKKILVVFHFFTLASQAQNNFLNPDFESYFTCPTGQGQIDLVNDWEDVVRTSDYINCGATLWHAPCTPGAFSGNGFAGFSLYGSSNGASEAIGQWLAQPLLPGHQYGISFATKKSISGPYDDTCAGVAFYGFKDAIPAMPFTGIHVSSLTGNMLLAVSPIVHDINWQVQSLVFSPPDTVNYAVFTAEFVLNCRQYLFMDDIHITDSSACIPPIATITSDKAAICPYDSVRICSPTGFTAYQWNHGGTSNCITTSQAGNYHVTVTDASGCTAQSNQLTITVNPLPVVSITSDTLTICSAESTQLCATSGFSIYQWNNSASDSCITTNLAGNYYVTVTDANSCTAASNRITVTVLPLPPISISINGDTLTVNNSTIQQWYLNGSAINGATANTYIATQGGSYTVMVTDSNGCTATSSPVIISGIDNITEQDIVSVYPNPLTAGGWQLTVGNSFIGGEAEMFDADGRIVFESEIRSPQSEIAPDVPKGVYLLRISSGRSSVVRKLVRL